METVPQTQESQNLPVSQAELPLGGRVGMILLCLGLIVLASVTLADAVLRLLAWLSGW